jgi:hypothetical protein
MFVTNYRTTKYHNLQDQNPQLQSSLQDTTGFLAYLILSTCEKALPFPAADPLKGSGR